MDEKMLVSIIVPVYNVENYIERCVQSLVNQTYTNLEIILVNDGSRDQSLAICKKMADADKRIVLMSKENEGAGYARNMGIEAAKGEYLLFVDSDDYLVSTCVARLMNVVDAEGCDVVKFKWIEGAQENYDIEPVHREYKLFDNHQAFRTREVDIGICGKLIKRNLLEGIRYPKESTHDDEFFTYKVIYAATKIAVLDEVYYYYFASPNSIMRKRRKELPLAYMKAYDERIKFFKDRNEKELMQISQKEYAIRLMLSYLSYKRYENSALSKKQLMNKFCISYKLGRATAYGWKEKCTLAMFCVFSKMVLSLTNNEDKNENINHSR